MELLFQLLEQAKDNGGWILAAIFGTFFMKERAAREKMTTHFIETLLTIQQTSLNAINNNTTVLTTIKDIVGRR